MLDADIRQSEAVEALRDAMRRYWGYDTFRPLQQRAMQAVLTDRDSVVVLPTGGGKSLCFQVPAVCRGGLAVVVSPLISLMKDQVDALTDCGVPAACINSTMSHEQRRGVADRIRAGELRLLYVAPERLVTGRTIGFLQAANVSFIAIDEAHCISHWGHDFRPEYRAMSCLRESFPDVSLHAYTATATPQVRNDIAEQLHLHDPEVLVGSFDRPNLIYKCFSRRDRIKQITGVIDRHRDESGIVYCITRNDVDETSAALHRLGYRARPYHAGLPDETRQAHQDAFIAEDIDTIVATVAFGMGIDKSNVRYVIHAGMPKSLEHYQQEAGRAGRDGLEAECILLYSMGDFNTWRTIFANSEGSATTQQTALASLQRMADYCSAVTCRHRMLVGHFGEDHPAGSCGACDICLGDVELMDEPLVVSQKILSSVVRQGQRFGGDYTAKVLTGSSDERIAANGHDALTTFSLLQEHPQRVVRDWIEQLVAQDFLVKAGEYNVLAVTEAGWDLLRGAGAPLLLKPVRRKKSDKRGRSVAADSWEGVDRELFEHLRQLRRDLAHERNVPPYIVFGDATLRGMARAKPTTLPELHAVRGVGEAKLAEYGETFLAAITDFAAGDGSPPETSDTGTHEASVDASPAGGPLD